MDLKIELQLLVKKCIGDEENYMINRMVAAICLQNKKDKQLILSGVSQQRELKIFNDLIDTVIKNSCDNQATITNVTLWAKSWRKEMKQEIEK